MTQAIDTAIERLRNAPVDWTDAKHQYPAVFGMPASADGPARQTEQHELAPLAATDGNTCRYTEIDGGRYPVLIELLDMASTAAERAVISAPNGTPERALRDLVTHASRQLAESKVSDLRPTTSQNKRDRSLDSHQVIDIAPGYSHAHAAVSHSSFDLSPYALLLPQTFFASAKRAFRYGSTTSGYKSMQAGLAGAIGKASAALDELDSVRRGFVEQAAALAAA